MAGLKRCSKCGEDKPYTEFHKNRAQADGHSGYCKLCRKERVRADWLWRQYHLTEGEYDALYEKQDGRCAICGLTEAEAIWRAPRQAEEAYSRFHVDHDHRDGHIRGLLCLRCNWGLGVLGEDIEVLLAMVSYLERG